MFKPIAHSYHRRSYLQTFLHSLSEQSVTKKLIAMGAFLLLQFLLVAIIIIFTGFWIIKSHIDGIPFSDSTIQIFLTFIGAYITSVVVELIAILRYIVKNVFDTSIAGMVNNFKDTKNT